MAKNERCKFRICRVFPSFQSCRSKDSSHLPLNPGRSFLRRPSANHNLIRTIHFPSSPPPQPPQPPPLSKPLHSSSSAGISFRLRSSFKNGNRSELPEFEWEEEENWHVIAKVYEDLPRRKIYNDDNILSPPSPLTAEAQTKRRLKTNKTTIQIRISTSSTDSQLFTSTECTNKETERETLISHSISFSTSSSSSSSPRRLSAFQRLIPCKVDGKVRESYAVVKKSENPYQEFKKSMMEMILEKEMVEERDLIQLLHCLLSLNSRNHHGLIVEAFSEIWEVMFPSSSL